MKCKRESNKLKFEFVVYIVESWLRKLSVARLAKIISDKYKNTWKMTKNDSPSAILLCTSIITILLTVKLHNILF